jgi:G3E family GTPase
VIFQGVHMLMGSDLGAPWAKDEVRESKMVFIGKDLPRDVLEKGLRRSVRSIA